MGLPIFGWSWLRHTQWLLLLWASCAGARADAPVLSLPIDCKLGETCFIQNYVDVDPSAGVKDYRCGAAAYNGHKGTDFRLLSTRAARAGVSVLAADDGVVKARRDGVADRLLGKDRSSVKGRECGNGVVIDHGGGWETQYCHMLRGSIQVRKGQAVKRGDPLGRVGYSGRTQFAHLHLSLRHAGKVIDPFTGQKPGSGTCGKDAAEDLWQPALRPQLTYRRGQIIQLGFADRRVGGKALEAGDPRIRIPTPFSGAMVFYARLINLEKGDRIRLRLSGPSGVIAENEIKPLARAKAQYVAFTGRKRRGTRWDAGRYEGSVEVLRAGEVALSRRSGLELR
ncbi:MAG: M23 family metallopeptidase [Methyloligellaceae bacterium]